MTAAWDRRPPAEQARATALAIADWLPGAVTFAPHWNERASELGLVADELVEPEDVRRFPPSVQGDVTVGGGAALVQRPTEAQVKAVAPSSLLMRIARGIGQDQRDGKRATLLREFKPVHVTRGGAASQLAIASSRADLDRLHRVGARAASMLGLGDQDYLVSAVPAGPSATFWAVHALALGSSMLALHPRGHGDSLAHCLEAFSLQPTTVVAVPVGEAIAWADALAEADADVSRVVVVLLVGPPPSEQQRLAVLQAWRDAGAQEKELVVRSMWMPDVHRGIWVECAEGTTGLHTSPDLEILEVLDPISGAPSTGGGDLTVTSLGWSGTTLLRYRTGSSIGGLTTCDEPCPACGRTVPRVVGPVVPGAWLPELRTQDGLVTLDLRAAAVELAAAASGSWRLVVERTDGADGYALELTGRVDETRARELAGRAARATGVTPSAVRLDGASGRLAAALRDGGSPFVDRR